MGQLGTADTSTPKKLVWVPGGGLHWRKEDAGAQACWEAWLLPAQNAGKNIYSTAWASQALVFILPVVTGSSTWGGQPGSICFGEGEWKGT